MIVVDNLLQGTGVRDGLAPRNGHDKERVSLKGGTMKDFKYGAYGMDSCIARMLAASTSGLL